MGTISREDSSRVIAQFKSQICRTIVSVLENISRAFFDFMQIRFLINIIIIIVTTNIEVRGIVGGKVRPESI